MNQVLLLRCENGANASEPIDQLPACHGDHLCGLVRTGR
jgi:hypothetical protein